MDTVPFEGLEVLHEMVRVNAAGAGHSEIVRHSQALASSATAKYERRIAGRHLPVEVTQPCW
jgi:hypothetical protein